MRRVRLRPAYTEQQFAELYPKPHQHDRWVDHRPRVQLRSSYAVVVRSVERHGVVRNTLRGVWIGVQFPLPKFDPRPGYPQPSIVWGRVWRRNVRW